MPAPDDDTNELAKARLGTVLGGKYRVERLLGVGGMAAVFVATHLRNANRVAVKVMHRDFARDKDLRKRFLREGYAANSVGHSGTVRILDDDVAEDDAPFLVMDLLEGETLDRRWERNSGRLGPGEVVTLMCDLLEVLAAAHAKGIVHRDIKPENLFLTHDSELKVLDFGIARLHKQASQTATGHGAVFGTPGFMPPEQALGHSDEIDALSDIWAVGATAYCLLSGHFVHEGRTSAETIVHAATRPVAPLSSVAPWVPASVAQVFDRALAFERRDRWPSAVAMRDALMAARNSGEPRTRSEADDVTKVNPPPVEATEGQPSSPEWAAPGPFEPATHPAGSTVAGLVSTNSEARRAQARKWVVVGAAAAAGLGVVLAIGVAIRPSPAGSPAPNAISPTADLRSAAGTIAPAAASALSPVPAAPESASLPWVPVDALPKAAPAASASAPVRTGSPAPRPHPATAPGEPAVAPRPSPPPQPPAAKRDPLAPPM